MANTPTANVGLNKPAQGDTPWDVTVNGNMDKLDSLLSGGTNVPNIALGGTLTKVNGVTTVAGGVPAIVAKADATAQAANIGTTTLYAVPANGAGMYRVAAYAVVTQAATVSSTLPNVNIFYTDNDTGIGAGAFITQQATGNLVGATNSANVQGSGAGNDTINVKASTTITYSTQNYASSGATPMQYAIHVKLEYLGL